MISHLEATETRCNQALKLRNKDLHCFETNDCLYLDYIRVSSINKQGK